MIEKARISQVWDAIVDAYDKTVEVGRYGLTGDPNKTLDVLFETGVTPEETRQVLAIQTAMRPHDLRFDNSREWLCLSLEPGHDWYTEYCRCFKGIDKIHPTHLDGLAMALKKRMS